MEDRRLNEVDTLRVSLSDPASPKFPCRSPIVRDKGDGFVGSFRRGLEVVWLEKSRSCRVPNAMKSPD